MSSIVDRLFPGILEYGAEGSPVVTIEREPGSEDLPEIACFDFIEFDTKTVPYSQLTSEEQTGVAEDERTVVLHFPSGYVCVDVEQLVGFAKNPNSKFYECRGVHYRSNHTLDDPLGKSFVRLGLGPGGSYFSVFTKNLVEFLKSGDRIVSVVSIPDSTVERTMSEDAAKQINPESYVSANHCQAGSSLSLSYLAKTVIEGVPTLATWPGVVVPLVTIHNGEQSTPRRYESVRQWTRPRLFFDVVQDAAQSQSPIDRDIQTEEITTLVGVDFNSGPANVKFAWNFDESIIGVDWGNVKSVEFGNNFRQPIVGVKWGNVETVKFGIRFNQPIVGVDWGNVKSVEFGNNFDQPIVGVNWGNVETIKFGMISNQPIVGVDWGNVKSIEFANNFMRPIVGVNWGNVETIKFGIRFNQPIVGVDWGNVKSVEFGSNFRKTMVGVNWGNVETVILGGRHYPADSLSALAAAGINVVFSLGSDPEQVLALQRHLRSS